MIIRDESTIEKITEICPNGSMLKGADSAILVLGDFEITDDYFVSYNFV